MAEENASVLPSSAVQLGMTDRTAENLLALVRKLDQAHLRPREQMMAESALRRDIDVLLTSRGWVWDAVHREWRSPTRTEACPCGDQGRPGHPTAWCGQSPVRPSFQSWVEKPLQTCTCPARIRGYMRDLKCPEHGVKVR